MCEKACPLTSQLGIWFYTKCKATSLHAHCPTVLVLPYTDLHKDQCTLYTVITVYPILYTVICNQKVFMEMNLIVCKYPEFPVYDVTSLTETDPPPSPRHHPLPLISNRKCEENRTLLLKRQWIEIVGEMRPLVSTIFGKYH